jgi:hypothetical protein
MIPDAVPPARSKRTARLRRRAPARDAPDLALALRAGGRKATPLRSRAAASERAHPADLPLTRTLRVRAPRSVFAPPVRLRDRFGSALGIRAKRASARAAAIGRCPEFVVY